MEKTVTSLEKKKIKKNRTMMHFIESADKIFRDEGIESITIRKVADIAGYNSSTIYHYFDNIDHLIFMIALNHLEDYHIELDKYTKGSKNSLELYMRVNKCFFKFSYSEPEIYRRLFFQYLENNYNEYAKQYYEIYPEKGVSLSKFLDSFIRKNNIYDRSLTMLNKCADEGFFTKENAFDYNNITLLLYYGQLINVLRNVIDADTACEQSMKYYLQIMTAYIDPEYKHILDQISL